MKNKDHYNTLLLFIPYGAGNAVSQKTLAQCLKCDERDVRQIIQNARIDGVPICSTQRGYFLSDDPEEVSECYKFFYQRHNTNGKVLETIRKHLISIRENGRNHE